MGRKKADYHLKKIAFTACAPRWVLDEFKILSEEYGFSRSEVISDFMENFIYKWKKND